MQPKASTNIEFITLSEAQIYVSRINPDHPDRYFQHILLGWMKFVAPLTPSSVDAVPHLKYNAAEPLNTIPESVEELLCGMTQVVSVDDPLSEAKSFSLLSRAWPTMWIWMQHIYHDHLQVMNRRMDAIMTDIFIKRYTLLGVLFTVLVTYDGEPMVAEIIASHPGIIRMMADMWIKEGTDKNTVHGFQAGSFPNPNYAIHQRFLAQVVSVCGSVEGFVHVACQRVERLLGQARRDYDVLVTELATLKFHISEELGDPSTITAAIYASSRVATLLMQVWAHITSSPYTINAGSSVAHRDILLTVCLVCTRALVDRSPQAYDRIVDILNHGFLSLLINSIPLMPSSSKQYEYFTTTAVAVIDNILCPATVHREILHRCVSASHGRGNFLPPTSNPRVHNSWSRLLKLLDERQNGYNSYKESTRSVIMCGNEKCSKVGRLRRCSACRISLYCSRECQRVKWVSHKTLCNSMKGKVHSCVDLSYPNLHYLSYLVALDIEVRHSAYIELVKARVAPPGSVPFFFLDCGNHSDCASSIHLLNANNKEPWLPFSNDDNLYKEWCKALVVPKEQVPPFLVAIPRGARGALQMMTLAVVLTDGGAGQHPAIGLRWLHCQ